MQMLFIYVLWFFGLFLLAVGVPQDWPSHCPDILSKSRWGGRKPFGVEYAIFPTKNIVIHHTVTDGCSDIESCSDILRSIQNFHIDTLEFHDIGYNFAIGGDGNIYEGVGWHKVGAHTRGYNSRSLGIVLIGNFSDELPTRNALKALKDLLDCGVEAGELDKNYKLFGARQVSATASPGARLFSELKNWTHFTRSP